MPYPPPPLALPAGRRLDLLTAALALTVAAGLAAALHLARAGHAVTGMTDHVVWGLPHVFALYLIVAASGAVNVASLASVFGRADHKPLAPLSALVGIALLVGGLAVLVLDLGRPDRLGVALLHPNPSSVFAWNILLYAGLIALAGLYLVVMTDRRRAGAARAAGLAVLLWRLALTSGTGLIFGLLVARPAFHGAILAPLFIAMSLAQGGALFLLVVCLLARLGGPAPDPAAEAWFARLLAVLVAVQLYLTLALHLPRLAAAAERTMELTLLFGAGTASLAFWLGLAALVGALTARAAGTAAALTVAGGLAQLYAILIGGQSVPPPLLPGRVVSSAFGDGAVAAYSPSLPEAALGLGGVALALLLVLAGCRLFRLLPAGEPA